MTVTGYQARMAHAALGASPESLAGASGVFVAVLQNFENGKHTFQDRTLRDICKALENSGVEFIDREVCLAQSTRMQLSKKSEG